MKTWSQEMGAKNVVVIEQGVDSNIMKPLKKDKELQKKLGINDQDKIVMYLGTTQSFCGLDFLIEKIPIILEKIPDFDPVRPGIFLMPRRPYPGTLFRGGLPHRNWLPHLSKSNPTIWKA